MSTQKFPASWPPADYLPQSLPTPAPDPFGPLVAALRAQTQAIEALVAVNAALLERLTPGEEEPNPDLDGSIPQPLGRKR